MPKIAIVGSRCRSDIETVNALVAGFPPGTVIVSGGCKGPDLWAEAAARSRGLPVSIHRPDLTGVRNRGEAARRYHARNQRVVDDADAVFAVVSPDRKGGTEDTISRAHRKGIPVTLL